MHVAFNVLNDSANEIAIKTNKAVLFQSYILTVLPQNLNKVFVLRFSMSNIMFSTQLFNV